MRTYQYQAWVKSLAQMYTVKTMRLSEQGVSLLYLLPRDGGGRGLTLDNMEDVALRDAIGITDSAGCAIYSGDILRTRTGALVEVRWNITGYGFWEQAAERWRLLYASDLAAITIVGNIYETPHLLHGAGA